MSEQKERIREFRQEEKLLEYLYQNQINPMEEPVPAELVRRFMPADDGYQRFEILVSGKAELREELCMDEQERFSIFLHPRFLPLFWHSHSYYEIKYVLQGRAVLSTEGQTYALESGDFCFVSPNKKHSCAVFDSETLLINIEIRADALRPMLQRVLGTENPISAFYATCNSEQARTPILLCHTGEDQDTRDLVRLIYDYKAGKVRRGLAEHAGELLVEQLLLLLIHDHRDQFSDSGKVSGRGRELVEVLMYINQKRGQVTLSELAKHFNYSDAYMSRAIKKYTGVSFTDLLRGARLDHAVELLRETDLPISSIAVEVGYTGKAHFYRLFRNRFGLTPAEFRDRLS